MTASLRDLLEEVAGQMPSPAAPQLLADAAWDEGRGQRRSRRLSGALAAAAVLAAVLLLPGVVVGRLPLRPGASTGATLTGHPVRIDRQWPIRTLPDRPGPVAALLETAVPGDNAEDRSHWFAVSASGHRWRLPYLRYGGDVFYPSLSRDGRQLGYLQDPDGPYVVRDLVTGRRVEFPQIGMGLTTNGSKPSTTYFMAGQATGYWSPDGRRLLMSGGSASGGPGLLLDVRAGTVTALPLGGGQPAGWAGNSTIVSASGIGGAGRPQAVDVYETDLSGRLLRTLRLQPDSPWTFGPGQNTSAVSPDGREFALAGYDMVSDSGVRRFSLVTGREVGPKVALDTAIACGPSWGGRLVMPSSTGGEVLAVQAIDSRGRTAPFAVVSPRVHGSCVYWAADGLSGAGAGGSRLGTSTAWWTWWWRELAFAPFAVLAAMVLVRAGWRAARRRLRRRSPAW